MNHAGASGAMVRALMNPTCNDSAAAGDAPIKGLIIAATGNGTIHRDLEEALLSAQASGVAVVRATRCPMGRVISTPDARIPDSKGLSPVKARIALMLALATGLPA